MTAQGILIPNELSIPAFGEYLDKFDLSRGVVLDGYPRTVKQTLALTKSTVEVNRVILLQASDAVCIKRISGRRMDPITGDSYNLTFADHMCQNEEVSARLVQRENDVDISIIQVRLKYYHMNLGQILKHFQG